MMKQLEGVQYEKSLYLNMVYYTIRLFSASQDMLIIVTEFRKLRYNRLPMRMWNLGDPLQAKVDQIIGDVKGVKICIDDILVLTK